MQRLAQNSLCTAPDSGEELVNQFAANMLKYCPEWNDRKIAEKKVELSFAYMFGKTEDINKLESEIETLTEKLRSKQDGN